MSAMCYVVANSKEQAQLHAEALVATSLGSSPMGIRFITTDERPNLLGMRVLPADVAYAPGWELGRYALDVVASLKRNYAGMLAAA